MKLFNRKKIALSVLLTICGFNLFAQHYAVNKVWETETAILGSNHFQAATVR